ncbi:hypothetical protein OIU84_023379 [Salix udensis]|uniref:Fe2OG dioxygenase domain-containing protein n=1 Tax=Salix udensis TaxID=889485 RepID=A0AAD6PG88_9ROSI|nr:hypothetical protein OIU84_023379 [Salix udensis]
MSQESVPLIDISKWDDPGVAEAICEAAEKWGFFQVINHGVPIEVLENVKEATHQFFGLSAEEKRNGKITLVSFYVSEDEASALWPSVCRDQVLEYMKRSEIVVRKLLERINLNYYPICPNPELTVGVGRHSDVSTLTVLLQDDVGGLYVRGNNDSWIHVPPVNGSIVINVGDALQIMSNGRYKSIEHRVIANGILASGEKAVYKEVLYSDYVRHFFQKAHDGKTTIEFAEI